MWRKIQTLGLSSLYKDKGRDIGKWLTLFFGMPFLPAEDIENCFVDDMMSIAPEDEKCHQFADYVWQTYVAPDDLSDILTRQNTNDDFDRF